jgi:hypothetical protein
MRVVRPVIRVGSLIDAAAKKPVAVVVEHGEEHVQEANQDQGHAGQDN